MEIEIQKLVLHYLDFTKNTIEHINIDILEENVAEYVETLITEIFESPNKREYKFKDGDTQVKASLQKLINNDDDIDEILLNNAQRLLGKEVETNDRMKRMGIKVQRGSLMHIHFTQNDNDNILICKVEHDEIMDEKSFDIIRGLNTKKKVFKAFLNYLPNKDRHEEIYLSDKNNSKYWWYGFLELEQIFTDEENTVNSLDKFVKIVDKERNNEPFSLDATLLRNNIVGYYRGNKTFNFSHLYDLISSYTPFNKNFPLSKITGKFNKLKEDSKFDNQFNIIQKKIDRKIITTIPLGKGLHLKIDRHVPNLSELMKPYEGDDGEQGIIILTSEAYRYVKILNMNDAESN